MGNTDRRFGSSQKHTYELRDGSGSECVTRVRVSRRQFPTSDVKVGGGGVARPVVVGGHAFVLALVGLFALLYLESSWWGTAKRGDREALVKLARLAQPTSTLNRR